MIRFSFTLAAKAYWFLHDHAPSNRLARRVRSQPRLAWAPICLIVSVGYLAAAIGLSMAVNHGWPGWLNIAVLILACSGLKTMWLAPASLVWTIRSRLTMTAGTDSSV